MKFPKECIKFYMSYGPVKIVGLHSNLRSCPATACTSPSDPIKKTAEVSKVYINADDLIGCFLNSPTAPTCLRLIL